MIRLGKRLELFVDDFLVDEMKGTALRPHEPRREAVAVPLDKPWDGTFANYGTVLKDGARFLLYYRGWHMVDRQGAAVYCRAESADGIRWTKPDYGLHAFGRAKRTNIFLAGCKATHSFSPFIDTRPGCPKKERFKAMGLVPGPQGAKTDLGAFVSADGLRWKPVPGPVAIPRLATDPHAFDSQNVAFWSEAEGQYLCYFRSWSNNQRRVTRAVSPDFIRWTRDGQMEYRRLGREVPVEELYVNQTFPYPRAPHLYVALAARFMKGKAVPTDEEAAPLGVEARYKNDCSDPVLLTSRGGLVYDRTFMGSLIRPGPDPKHWTSRTNYPALNLVQTGPGELSMYTFEGYGQTANACIRRYSLRLDGLGSVNAPWDGGTFTTKPFTFEGASLRLNYGCSTAGGLRVAVTTAAGKPVKGFGLDDCTPVYGDRLDHAVQWKGGSLGKLSGKAVRLSFEMKDADLYALRFE